MSKRPTVLPATLPAGTRFIYKWMDDAPDVWVAQEEMRLGEEGDFYFGLVTCDNATPSDNKADADLVDWASLPERKSNKDACNCHQAKALQSELADLRAAAFQVLAWIDRSHTVSREAAQRLERALAVGAREAESEVVGS